jgi:nitrogen regulatory protein PII
MRKNAPFSKFFSIQPDKKPDAQESADVEAAKPSLPELRLILFIVDWNRANVVSDVFLEEKVRFHFTSKGRGTANSEILDLLGIGGGDKAVVICLEQHVMVQVLMKEVRKKLRRSSPGAGIAFTVPLSAINDPILLIFKQSIHKNEKIAAELAAALGLKAVENSDQDKDSKGGSMENNAITHDLIVAAVNHGYSDELMNTARGAGASGGTVINARGQAHEGAVKFFGISVQDEKELILILTSREKKVPLMKAICEAHGLNSRAQGIIFSLPVDNVMGLSLE